MSHTPSKTKTVVENLLVQKYALSLIKFAQTDQVFADLLAAAFGEYDVQGTADDLVESGAVSLITSPIDRDDAFRRLTWLQRELSLTEPTATLKTQAILSSFSSTRKKTRTLPKSPLFGFVGIAIIGPTLGLIKRRKRKGKLSVLVADRYKTVSREKVGALTIKASGKLLSEALHKLLGDATRLEVELAEWFFEDRNTNVQFCNQSELNRVQNMLKVEQLPHTAVIDDGQMVALAISPIVDLTKIEVAKHE